MSWIDSDLTEKKYLLQVERSYLRERRIFILLYRTIDGGLGAFQREPHFAAGLIYGLLHYEDEEALNFASAACALKHAVPGDVNMVSLENVLNLMKGDTSGTIIR